MLFSSKHPFILCVLLLTKSSASTDNRVPVKFYSSTESKPLSRQERDNLRLMLNFIRESPEFRPLTFSVVLPELQSSFVDFLLSYINENSIEAYKLDARDSYLAVVSGDRTRLTWIVVIPDLLSFNLFIYWQEELWKSNDQYLIVFTGEGINVAWRNVFRGLWRKYNVYKVIAIFIDDEFRCLIRYMPFAISRDMFGSVHKLCLSENTTRNFNHDEFTQNATKSERLDYVDKVFPLNGNVMLFENFRDLNQYPLNVIVFESLLMNITYDDHNGTILSKPDANVLSILEQAMGTKFRLKAVRKVDFKQDPFTMSLKEIEGGHADMVVTGFFMKVYEKFHKFQFTCAMYEDKLCFLAPDSGLVPKAYMPFLPFQKDLWALLMFYNIIITLLWRLVIYISGFLRQKQVASSELTRISQLSGEEQSKIRNKLFQQMLGDRALVCNRSQGTVINFKELSPNTTVNNLLNYKKPSEIPRNVTRFFTFVENFCYPLQESKAPAQRALLFGTLFFGLIVNGLYQSYLVSSLSKPFHYPQIQTLEDVIESGKVVITRYANLKSVFLDDSELDMKLSQRIHVVRSKRSTKELVAYENKISITRFYTMELGNYAYYDSEGTPLLYVVDECPMNYRVSYVLRLHSPYADKVDFILLRSREAGLLNFWFENTLDPVRMAKMRRKLEMEKRRIKLTLDHYSLTFLLLFLGLLGSTLMFFGELYTARRNTRDIDRRERKKLVSKFTFLPGDSKLRICSQSAEKGHDKKGALFAL